MPVNGRVGGNIWVYSFHYGIFISFGYIFHLGIASTVYVLTCAVVVLTCFVMCGFFIVCVCVCVCVGVLVIC